MRAVVTLDVHETVLPQWIKLLSADPQHVFLGQGKMKPNQAEIDRLRNRVGWPWAECDSHQRRPQPFSRGT